ncbi:helix-turn-helix domain-containing protein [Bradyrhizobium guangzhouense]|uniref:AraC family transcriptional regulator n=2 Tax=Bradyrhizobium guangzhouense TaxID=1325095 RepID=A0AAE5WW92_9BRAD|nr:AraC family transcriptional regulator [Bradyrhizobium guangzhouense]RXH05377.1 helix-turn-helix domain-containing protein [Bradyrhizobium guangzhouense]
MVHRVCIVAMDQVIAYDLTLAYEVFARLRDDRGKPFYDVRVCAETARVDAGAFGLVVPFGLEILARAHTIIVPGIENPLTMRSKVVLRALQRAYRRGARLASVCSGAFVLAEAGLLDGRRATTHWLGADRLASLYPQVKVDPNVLYVDDGQIVTSAGASAGMDMCLHLVRRDFGQAVAAHAARLAVAPINREGGQAQFIRRDPPRSNGSLAPHLEWVAAHLGKPLTVARMAAQARMSERSFARHFRQQMGVTPMQWLLNARIRRAQELLESSTAYVDQIAEACGFQSTVTFRMSFRRIAGISPGDYRRRFNDARS